MVFVVRLVLLVFSNFIVLYFQFCCVCCMIMKLCLWCHIVVGFPWFSSSFCLGLSFIVLNIHNWLGKRKVNGTRRESYGT